MAHFAEINPSGRVQRVIVVSDAMLLDEQGHESEALGIAFCRSIFGAETRWVQASYTGKFRKNFAGEGCVYDPVRDAFIPPKPDGDYWRFDDQACRWYDPAMQAAKTTLGVTRV